MYPIPNFFIPLLCGLLAVIPVSARDIPSSLFMAKEEVPPLIKKAEEPPKVQPLFVITLGGIMQTNAGEQSVWINDKCLVTQDNKPLDLAHGIVIEKVEAGCVHLTHKERTMRLYPGQTVTVDITPSAPSSLVSDESPQTQKPTDSVKG